MDHFHKASGNDVELQVRALLKQVRHDGVDGKKREIVGDAKFYGADASAGPSPLNSPCNIRLPANG
jgi:hypothetical protein